MILNGYRFFPFPLGSSLWTSQVQGALTQLVAESFAFFDQGIFCSPMLKKSLWSNYLSVGNMANDKLMFFRPVGSQSCTPSRLHPINDWRILKVLCDLCDMIWCDMIWRDALRHICNQVAIALLSCSGRRASTIGLPIKTRGRTGTGFFARRRWSCLCTPPLWRRCPRPIRRGAPWDAEVHATSIGHQNGCLWPCATWWGRGSQCTAKACTAWGSTTRSWWSITTITSSRCLSHRTARTSSRSSTARSFASGTVTGTSQSCCCTFGILPHPRSLMNEKHRVSRVSRSLNLNTTQWNFGQLQSISLSSLAGNDSQPPCCFAYLCPRATWVRRLRTCHIMMHAIHQKHSKESMLKSRGSDFKTNFKRQLKKDWWKNCRALAANRLQCWIWENSSYIQKQCFRWRPSKSVAQGLTHWNTEHRIIHKAQRDPHWGGEAWPSPPGQPAKCKVSNNETTHRATTRHTVMLGLASTSATSCLRNGLLPERAYRAGLWPMQVYDGLCRSMPMPPRWVD